MQRRRTCNRDGLAQEAENIDSLALSRKFADPCLDRLTFIYLIFCWWAFWGAVSRLWGCYKGGCCVHLCACLWVSQCMRFVVYTQLWQKTAK